MKTFAQELEASLVKTIKTLVSEETKGPRKPVNHQVDSALERHGFNYSHAENGRHVYKHPNGDTASLARTGMGNLSFHHHSGTEVKNGAAKPIWKSGRTGDTEIVNHLNTHYGKSSVKEGEMKEALVTRKRELSVPEKHQLRIARDTLRMHDAAVGIMGGPNKEEARQIIFRLTGKRPTD